MADKKKVLLVIIGFLTAAFAVFIAVKIYLPDYLSKRPSLDPALAPTLADVNAIQMDDEAMARASQFYAMRCQSCHGRYGQGTGLAPSFQQRDWKSQEEAAYVYRVIYDGRPNAGMPGWGYKLLTEDLRLLTAYVMKLSKKPQKLPLNRNTAL